MAILNSRIWLPGVRAMHLRMAVLAGLTRVLIILALFLPITVEAQTGSGHNPELIDGKRIEGYWVRPDGGYILHLQDIKENGELSAGYYNPRPIKVSRAEVSNKDGTVSLRVELQDVNYPGSTYTLAFDPATDRLRGIYFQAASGKSFQIEFERMQ